MASKTKQKTVIHATKYANGAIVCETAYDQHLLQNLPIGTAVKMVPMNSNRNYQHHKKFFKLLEIGFEYWTPEFSVMSAAERWIAHEVAKRMASKAQDCSLYERITKDIADEVIFEVRRHRENKLDYEGMKTLEAYLNHVMKKAGFYEIKPLPDGGTLKERWSIAFDKLPQEKFNEVYKSVFGVIWNETLCQVYADEWALENKVNQLMSFH